jgi:tRNA(Ile)-lysidine synthase
MASSRSWTPADVDASVARALDAHAGGVAVLAVALSGGRDSLVLLDALARLAPQRGMALCAIHVHHGLSAHADEWAAFCAAACARLGLPFALRRVHVRSAARDGIEDAARRERYAALANAAGDLGADAIALAHHQDDQAETLLLQLGRGAGPQGLAAMAPARRAHGLLWLRPLLDLPRAAIDTCVDARAIAHVDDDSNASTRHRRNALRQRVAPALAAVFPGYPGTFARAASLQAEAAQLLDQLAAADARTAIEAGLLDRNTLLALDAPRARNLLRHFLRLHGLPAPSAARLAAMLDQITTARADARVRLAHAGVEIGIHRGQVAVHAPAPAAYALAWQGESTLQLPHGTLAFETVAGEGLCATRLARGAVVVRARSGGERLQLAADRPRQAVKALLRDAGVPHWERGALPTVWCGDALAAVAGIGVDMAFRARPGEAGFRLAWLPAPVALL